MGDVKKICPKCKSELHEWNVIDWDNDLEIYECSCNCIVDFFGNDITDIYDL